jgi:2-dehydro-3-deoxyphosphogluconate aldolase / (4S)-4-hydroxy-2-oxoglutarate aldolase
VGAGTVTAPEEVDECVAAGAQFIVSPGFDDEVVEAVARHGVLAVPGVATATEVQRAMRAGLTLLKLFPAEFLGGVAGLRAIGAPFRKVRFMPSGGVGLHNVRDYLAEPQVLTVSGAWMAPRQALSAVRVDEVEKLSRQTMSVVGHD